MLEFFLRPLIPRWRFFNEAGSPLKLFCRTAKDDEWKELHFASRTRRSIWQLFLNSEENLALSEWGLVEEFLDETSSSQKFNPDSVSFLLFVNFLSQRLGAKHFQFKLCDAEGDILISDFVEATIL